MLLPTHKIVLSGAKEGQGAEVVYVELGEDEGVAPAYASDAEKQGLAEPAWQLTPQGWLHNGNLERRIFKVELVSRSLSIIRHYEGPEEFATLELREEAKRAHRLIEWQGIRWSASAPASGGAMVQAVESLFLPAWGLAGVVIGGAGPGQFVGTEPATWLANKSAAAAIHLVLDIRGT
jgi:hypothetical protein